jgi:glycosyltransferase involved in cell wall biosynthesis
VNEDPLVSVIIPTYNRAELLVESLESLLGQSYPNLEIVIVDDGSTDGTEARVRPMLCASGRSFRYHWQENQGVYAAGNKGISLATGPLLSFGASDDLWKKDALRKQVDFLKQNPDCDVVICDTESFGGPSSGRGMLLNPPPKSEELLNRLFATYFTSLAAAVIRRHVFEDVGFFDTRLKIAGDYDICLRMAVRHKFGILPEKLYLMREHTGKMSSDFPTALRETHDVLLKFMNNHPDLVPKEIVGPRMRRITSTLGEIFLRLGRPRTALKYLATSMKYGLPSSANAKNMLKSVLRLLY